MDNILKLELNTRKLSSKGFKGKGTISEGEAYETDIGDVFVKCNNDLKARQLYDGEFEGLSAVAATNTVAVPTPIKVLDNPDGGACLVTSHLQMTAELGVHVARLHLHNQSLREANDSGYVEQFGFHKTTFHRLVPQDNKWKQDWMTFFVENRLHPQFQIIAKEKKDIEAIELWEKLEKIIPIFFEGIEIKPSLLHGDLWGGNVAETVTEPVVFDLASAFYGHHEYDIATSILWGGFTPTFYNAYHEIIPKASGFNERKKIYQLFQYLHHWIELKDLFRGHAISLMKSLLRPK